MPVALDPNHVALMRGPVSIHVASRDGANVPSVARALGCRVADDGSSIAVFLHREQARQLLADVRTCGRVAVVFTRPSTHQTIQLKAGDAREGSLEDGDAEAIGRYVEAFVRELATIGYAEEIGRTLLAAARAELVALTFTPDAGFRQTPGPAAGTPLTR